MRAPTPASVCHDRAAARPFFERRRRFVRLDAREYIDRLARGGAIPQDAVGRLATAAQRLRPWPDSRDGLERLARDFTVVGLSDASRRTLAGLSSSTGLRWHQVLSAQDAGTYKPDPALYATALDAAPSGTGAPFMVAAHAWDLRAAADAGMRTAYVPRRGGDRPRDSDVFDVRATDLWDLHAQLVGTR